MARDAAARLYDVDEDRVVFKKLYQSQRYDQGTITFHARPGKLIDLDKLHESIWATRLSGGTRSGLVSLDVRAIGYVDASQDPMLLRVESCDAIFILAQHPDKQYASVLDQLNGAAKHRVQVTGRIADYAGRWPDILNKKPPKPWRILVTGFELLGQDKQTD